MSDRRVITFLEIQDHMGTNADPWNIMIVTQCAVYDANDEEVYVSDGVKLSLEGFILHPRRLEHDAFEYDTEDLAEIDYLLRCITTSAASLAAATAGGNEFARQSFVGRFGRNVEAAKEQAAIEG